MIVVPLRAWTCSWMQSLRGSGFVASRERGVKARLHEITPAALVFALSYGPHTAA